VGKNFFKAMLRGPNAYIRTRNLTLKKRKNSEAGRLLCARFLYLYFASDRKFLIIIVKIAIDTEDDS
jgi:hypothetical protein